MSRFRTFYLQQQFIPNGFSILLNPFYFIRLDLYKVFKRMIPLLKGSVLDYGCGRKPYQSLFTADSYIGADIENEGHSHAQEDIDIYFDGKHLPVENESFDCVFSSEVFEHIFDPDESLQEIYRILKPGGKILMSVPFVWNEHEIPNDYARYSSYGFPYLLKKNGFEILEIHKTGNFVRVIIQLWALYLYRGIERLPVKLRALAGMILISPVFLTGVVWDFLLPTDKSLYFNLVVLAQKKA